MGTDSRIEDSLPSLCFRRTVPLRVLIDISWSDSGVYRVLPAGSVPITQTAIQFTILQC
jgi:hypothetical protein